MATFTPFMQGSEAQSIISNYLGGGYDTAKTTPFRNPIFDIRTQQELAGELDPSALYPNPQIDYSVDPAPADPCPEGYQLIDGVCQPIENFGESIYDPLKRENEREDLEPREYYSIEDMKELGDYELLNYLSDGWLKGDPYDISVGGKFGMPLVFQPLFGKQNEMRRNFIISELAKRGYNIDSDQGQQSLGQALSILGNAQAANLGGNRMATNQPSIFTPEEINYQIQAKNQAQDIVNQGGNPYERTMTRQQIIDDADLSGGTRNPYEMNQVNQQQVRQPQYTGVNPFKDEEVWI